MLCRLSFSKEGKISLWNLTWGVKKYLNKCPVSQDVHGSAMPRQPGPVFVCWIWCARRPLGFALCFHAIPPACTEKEYFYHWYHFIFAAVCWHQVSNINSVREQSLPSTGCKIHNYYLELTSSESVPYWNCSAPKRIVSYCYLRTSYSLPLVK